MMIMYDDDGVDDDKGNALGVYDNQFQSNP